MVHNSKFGISGSILIKICIWIKNPHLDPDYSKIAQIMAFQQTLLDKPACIVGGGHQPLCACCYMGRRIVLINPNKNIKNNLFCAIFQLVSNCQIQ